MALGPVPAAAVADGGQHEQAVVFLHPLAEGLRRGGDDLGRELVDLLVEGVLGQVLQLLELGQRVQVGDRSIRGHYRVVPAMVVDDLSAAARKCPDVRAGCRGDGREHRLRLIVDRRPVNVAAPFVGR